MENKHHFRHWIAGNLLLPILVFLLLSSEGWGVTPFWWWTLLIALSAAYAWSVGPYIAETLGQAVVARRKSNSRIVVPDGHQPKRRGWSSAKAVGVVLIPLAMCTVAASYVTYQYATSATAATAPSPASDGEGLASRLRAVEGERDSERTKRLAAEGRARQIQEQLEFEAQAHQTSTSAQNVAALSTELAQVHQEVRNANAARDAALAELKSLKTRLAEVETENRRRAARCSMDADFRIRLTESKIKNHDKSTTWHAVNAIIHQWEQFKRSPYTDENSLDWLASLEQLKQITDFAPYVESLKSPLAQALIPTGGLPVGREMKTYNAFNQRHNEILNEIEYYLENMRDRLKEIEDADNGNP